MKKVLVDFFIFFLFIPSFIYCDIGYSIESMSFIPPRYYVGDEVELKIKISIPKTRELLVPENLEAATEWIEITDIQVLPFKIDNERKVHDMSIFFISFKTGTHPLPYIELGDIELSNLEIHTLSVLDKNKETNLTPYRGQLNLPDTWMKLSLIILLIVLVPIFLFIIVRKVLYWFIKSGLLIKLKIPKNILLKELKKLRKQISNIDHRSFYIILSDLFKQYLQIRLSIPALTSTTREISVLAYNNVLERELSNEILKILSLSDFVKFGERPSNENEMNDIIRKIFFIVTCIEEEKKSVEP